MKRKTKDKLIKKLVEDTKLEIHPEDIVRLIDLGHYDVAVIYLLSSMFDITGAGMKLICNYLSPLSREEISRIYAAMSMYVLCRDDSILDEEEGVI